jgi:hypothetical protein
MIELAIGVTVIALIVFEGCVAAGRSLPWKEHKK